MSPIDLYREIDAKLRSLVPKTGPAFSSGVNLRLERIERLMASLGSPHHSYRSIHVGGTSGKGSTANIVEAGLRQAGMKTGLHTSPHLQIINERHRVDGVLLSTTALNRVFDRLWPHVLDVGTGCEWGLPSYFEAQVAISLLAFADERVDVAVVEVGLGGTLDATNVLPAETVVITNVGLDHTEILGNTVEEIAKDKAGIIKEGTRVVVTGATQESVRRIIERRCRAVGSDLIVVDTNHEDAQRANFQVADAALKTFGVGLPNGLSGTTIAGRFERVQSDPTVVLDGAHNSEKMLALSRWIARQKRPEQRSVVVLGVKLGKDLRSILRAVDPRCSILIATEFRMSSGLWSSVEAAVLADVWREAESERNCTTIVEPDPLRAVETAIALAISQGIDDVVVTGSLYLVGNVREKWVPSEWLIKAAEQNLVRGDLRPNR